MHRPTPAPAKRLRHPPFNPGPAKSKLDFTTREGANFLANVIRTAWAKAGHDVPVVVEPVPNARTPEHTLCWAVRMPTLVRGLPMQAPA